MTTSSAPRGALFTVGFVLFVATTIVVTGLFWIGAGGGLLRGNARYHVLCPSTTGLKKGTRVYLQGVPVGTVEAIEFLDDLSVPDVRVSFSIAGRAAQRRIRADSEVTLASEGLLGDVAVHITAGTPDAAVLEKGDELRYRSKTLVDQLVGQEITGSASRALSELVLILRKLERGDGTLGKLINDAALYERVESLTESLHKITTNLEQTTTEVNRLLVDARERPGALGRLLLTEEDQILLSSTLRSSSAVARSLESIARKVESGDGLAARVLSDKALADRVASLVAHLEDGSGSLEVVLGLLARGEGTVGRWLHDPTAAVALEDVLLGVREGGYMQNLIRNAERKGREGVLREDRASELARIAASRARFIASLESGDESARPVPSALRGEESARPADGRKNDGKNETPDVPPEPSP